MVETFIQLLYIIYIYESASSENNRRICGVNNNDCVILCCSVCSTHPVGFLHFIVLGFRKWHQVMSEVRQGHVENCLGSPLHQSYVMQKSWEGGQGKNGQASAIEIH